MKHINNNKKKLINSVSAKKYLEICENKSMIKYSLNRSMLLMKKKKKSLSNLAGIRQVAKP
uniref:Uncharacterized protein n=1 Tax=Octopus bimaculoides TaxID=37653 RepID=A0A0L8GFK9_OCTBM